MLALPQNEGAQTVTLVPRDRLYRVALATDVTYEIVDPRRSETDDARVVVAEDAATEDETSCTLDGVAGDGSGDDYTIPLASTSGLTIGRTYMLIAADDRSESAVIGHIESGASASALAPIRQPFESGDELVGVEWTASVPEAALSSDDGAGPLLVIWRYTLDGVTFVIPQAVFASRFTVAPPLTDAELALSNPPLARRIAAAGLSLDQAIAVAMTDYLGELGALRIDPHHVLIAPATAKLAVREKATEHAARWVNDPELAADAREQYRSQMNNIRLGMAPLGTVDIEPVTNTAAEGSSRKSRGFFRRA